MNPATAPSIAMRWSPRRVIGRRRWRAGTPRTRKPSGVAAMRTPSGAAVDDGLDAVRLLRAQLLGAADDALAAGSAASEREERQLVDEQRHLPRADVGRRRAGRRTSRSPTGSPPTAPVEDGDARAHALEHVEEAGARGLRPTPWSVQLGAGERAWRRRSEAPPTRSRRAPRPDRARAARRETLI